jgi:hypothetical protein
MGSGTARLEEAVAACRDALKERTRERVPLDWAMSLGNQGVAMILLAGCPSSTSNGELTTGPHFFEHRLNFSFGIKAKCSKRIQEPQPR